MEVPEEVVDDGFIGKIAPPMARFRLGKGTGVGIICEERTKGIMVRLSKKYKKRKVIFRSFSKHNVQCYPEGIILKN